MVRGQVESVQMLRESWGRAVVLCGSDRERAVVMGTVLGISPGDTVEAHGLWTSHPDYGRQFKAQRIEVVVPEDGAGAIEWMLGRLPQVGRKQATAMVERWPVPELWDVLALDPVPPQVSPLAELRGITPERAVAIHQAYREHRSERDLMVRLKGWGLTEGQCAGVVMKYGADAPFRLRANPYALIEELHGWGWKRADRLALKMGLPADHPGRIRACLSWMLDEAQGAGHVFVPAGRLVAMVARELHVASGAVKREANDMLDAGQLVLRPSRRGPSAAYTPKLDRAEARLARSVRRLLGRGEQTGVAA